MSYLMNSFGLGLGLTSKESTKENLKKVPFTTEQLIKTKDKLTRVDNQNINQWTTPLDSNSWKYLNKWIKANPRGFTESQLVKFRNVILDPDLPSIRQKFTLKLNLKEAVNEDVDEPVNWAELMRSFRIIAIYFVGINILASSF